MQVPHSICAEIQEKSILRKQETRDKRDIAEIMPMERCRDSGGRSMSRSHTHVGKHPAQDERIRIHGIFEREKRPVNIPKMGKHEICIQKSRILV